MSGLFNGFSIASSFRPNERVSETRASDRWDFGPVAEPCPEPLRDTGRWEVSSVIAFLFNTLWRIHLYWLPGTVATVLLLLTGS